MLVSSSSTTAIISSDKLPAESQATVTGSSPDPTSYRVTFDGTDGVGVRAGAGPADVTFVQDLETAVGISTGSLSALAALQEGRLSVNGDVDSLHLLQPVLAALDTTWSPLTAAAT